MDKKKKKSKPDQDPINIEVDNISELLSPNPTVS